MRGSRCVKFVEFVELVELVILVSPAAHSLSPCYEGLGSKFVMSVLVKKPR